MLIYNVRERDLIAALDAVNEIYDGNAEFRRIEYLSETRGETGQTWRVTLRVKDSHGPGARRGFSIRKDGERRRTPALCWHAHGEFFDALPPESWIISSTGAGRRVITPGETWLDWNAGSQWYPAYMSELCDC